MLNIASFTFDELRLGSRASFETVVSEETVQDFIRLSGDANPLHTDEAYAAQTQFGGRIAHGMIAGALFSRLVGVHLPGKYSLYLSQTLTFHEPMAIGSTVRITGKVTHIQPAFRVVTIATEAHDALSGKLLVSGTALVKMMQ